MPQGASNLPALRSPEQDAVATYRLSTNAATACAAIVKQTASVIQGKKYVACTGWQAIAVAHGCTASSCHVERVEGGFRATGQVRRMDTGAVIAEAEGFVGEDEPVWFGGTDKRGKRHEKRADFAIRAMAQTRAISRACRSAFAHVVVLIDKNLGTTPAEEMQGVVDHMADSAPFAGNTLHEAAEEIAQQTGNTESQYRANKRKVAIDNDWVITNTTPKGKDQQIAAYIDLAETPDHVSKILNNNAEWILQSPQKATIEEDAERLLRWFEEQSAPQ